SPRLPYTTLFRSEPCHGGGTIDGDIGDVVARASLRTFRRAAALVYTRLGSARAERADERAVAKRARGHRRNLGPMMRRHRDAVDEATVRRVGLILMRV